jgi:hypothetical protein
VEWVCTHTEVGSVMGMHTNRSGSVMGIYIYRFGVSNGYVH